MRVIKGDCRRALAQVSTESVQCCVTSPPYWNLRDYGVAGQIGLEATFEEYLEQLVAVFAEVRRVLKPDGTCWVNMGDCYVGSRGGPQGGAGSMAQSVTAKAAGRARGSDRKVKGLKPKNLVGQPWPLAFALQADGWWLRRDIIWHKPSPMPETVFDRPSTAHEYVFLLSKSARYYYNFEEAREPVSGGAHRRGSGVNRKCAGWAEGPGTHRAIDYAKATNGTATFRAPKPRQNESFSAACKDMVDVRNWRSVWTIPTEPYPGDHFATFPTALASRCIIAGTRPGDIVLDPFAGSGTTGKAALELGRRAVLVELSCEYAKLIDERCTTTLGLPLGP